MPGYKVQVKGEDGGMVDIPLAAQYDGKGKEISSEYATKASVNEKYTKPSGGIPESDLSAEVRTSLSRADSALQAAPVTSVNSKTGNVVLSAEDVGAATEESVSAILNNTSLIKNQSGGFQGGTGASAANGAAIGKGAKAYGGGAIGSSAKETSGGGAVGIAAKTQSGGAVGSTASATIGGAIGSAASATSGGAVGSAASATDGFAGGYNAKATANGAVQLGQGTNNNANTLKFRDYQIVDANGNIPVERLSANSPVRSVNGETGAVTLSASDVGAATAAQGAKADSAAQLNKAQTWTQEQRFNAGFTALNGNFSFSDTTNIGMELGRRDGTAGTPYIDFHTDGSSSTDYNSRLLATGNQIQVTASGGLSLNGDDVITDEIEEVSFVLNTEYFSHTTNSAGQNQTRLYRLFGTKLYIVTVNVNVIKAITTSTGSVWVINQFAPQGATIFQSVWKRSSHYVIGGARINGGGNALWLDPFDGMPTINGTTIQCAMVFVGNR